MCIVPPCAAPAAAATAWGGVVLMICNGLSLRGGTGCARMCVVCGFGLEKGAGALESARSNNPLRVVVVGGAGMREGCGSFNCTRSVCSDGS